MDQLIKSIVHRVNHEGPLFIGGGVSIISAVSYYLLDKKEDHFYATIRCPDDLERSVVINVADIKEGSTQLI